jgi:hypothetical protein
VEHLAIPGRGGGIGEDGGRDLRDQLVDQQRLRAVDQQETRNLAGGEIAKEGRRLQRLGPCALPRSPTGGEGRVRGWSTEPTLTPTLSLPREGEGADHTPVH